jgi:hypothetical protein
MSMTRFRNMYVHGPKLNEIYQYVLAPSMMSLLEFEVKILPHNLGNKPYLLRCIDVSRVAGQASTDAPWPGNPSMK